jgi:hypothetical protein
VIAIADPKWSNVYVQYIPEGIAFSNFELTADVREMAGSPNASFGIVFAAQPKAATDKVNARYNFLVIPDEQASGVTYTSPMDQRTLVGRTSAATLLTGNAVNHLQLTYRNRQITIGINGQSVATYSSTQMSTGAIGLVVLNPSNGVGTVGASVAFSHLRVTSLPNG